MRAIMAQKGRAVCHSRLESMRFRVGNGGLAALPITILVACAFILMGIGNAQEESPNALTSDVPDGIVRALRSAGDVRVLGKPNDPNRRAIVTLKSQTIDDQTMDHVRELFLILGGQLKLKDTSVTEEGIAKLRRTRVESILLSGERVSDEIAEALTGLRNLEHLHLERTNLTDDGFRLVGKCSELTKLILFDNRGTVQPPMAYLGSLTNLTSLSLFDDLSKADVSSINALKKIDELTAVLASNEAKSAFMDLKCLDTLKRLSMSGKCVDDDVLALIGRRSLILRELYLRECASATAVGWQSISALTDIEVLSLARSPVTDHGVEHLAKLKRLHWLDLKGTSITDKSLDFVAKLSALSRLTLVDTDVTDDGIESLVALQNLRDLQLQRTLVRSVPKWMSEREGLTVEVKPRAQNR